MRSVNHPALCRYLRQNGLLDLSAQHAKMALFCVDYLLSEPFRLMASEEELKEYSEKGYYALIEYAGAYWIDHLLAVMDQNLNFDTLVKYDSRLVSQVERFLRETQILDQHQRETLDRDSSRLFATVRRIP